MVLGSLPQVSLPEQGLDQVYLEVPSNLNCFVILSSQPPFVSLIPAGLIIDDHLSYSTHPSEVLQINGFVNSRMSIKQSCITKNLLIIDGIYGTILRNLMGFTEE